jgi:hypothetical protein
MSLTQATSFRPNQRAPILIHTPTDQIYLSEGTPVIAESIPHIRNLICDLLNMPPYSFSDFSNLEHVSVIVHSALCRQFDAPWRIGQKGFSAVKIEEADDPEMENYQLIKEKVNAMGSKSCSEHHEWKRPEIHIRVAVLEGKRCCKLDDPIHW